MHDLGSPAVIYWNNQLQCMCCKNEAEPFYIVSVPAGSSLSVSEINSLHLLTSPIQGLVKCINGILLYEALLELNSSHLNKVFPLNLLTVYFSQKI